MLFDSSEKHAANPSSLNAHCTQGKGRYVGCVPHSDHYLVTKSRANNWLWSRTLHADVFSSPWGG